VKPGNSVEEKTGMTASVVWWDCGVPKAVAGRTSDGWHLPPHTPNLPKRTASLERARCMRPCPGLTLPFYSIFHDYATGTINVKKHGESVLD